MPYHHPSGGRVVAIHLARLVIVATRVKAAFVHVDEPPWCAEDFGVDIVWVSVVVDLGDVEPGHVREDAVLEILFLERLWPGYRPAGNRLLGGDEIRVEMCSFPGRWWEDVWFISCKVEHHGH